MLIPTTHVFHHEAGCYNQLSCTIQTVKHNIYIFRQIFRVRRIHGNVVNSVTLILHLTVNQKKVCTFPILLSSYFHQRVPLRVQHQPFELLNLSVLHVHSAYILAICKAVKVFVTFFALMHKSSSCFSVFLGNVIIHFSSGICRKVSARKTCK